MRCLAVAALFVSITGFAAGAIGIGDDAWDWYSGMSPYEQCMDYLSGDPDIETVLAEDLSFCEDLWGRSDSQ